MQQGTKRVPVSEVRAKLRKLDGPTIQSINRADDLTGHFETFIQRAFGIDVINDITSEHVVEFVNAKGATGDPAITTMHVRRAALRMLFRVARLHFGYQVDPTIDFWLPPKTRLEARPLTEDEVVLGRSYSLHTLKATRQPAAWALCEATAITAELGHITVEDLELDDVNGPRVWLHGSRKRDERWGLLDDWGATQLERRASAVGDGRLIYRGNGSEESQHMSCCNAIRETLIRAGLNSEPDVQPPSLTAWAGVMAHEETGSIEGAALRLGFRSLDAAARFISFNWRG